MKRTKGSATPLVDKGLLQRVKSFKNDLKTLLKTPNGNPLHAKYSVNTHKGEAGGKHGDVFFVGLKDNSSDQTFAIKRQVINAPKSLTDRSYRELLIFQHLNQLASDNKCSNFVEIIDWFKAKPNIMTPERQGSKQLMHFVLEYADGATLNEHRDNKLTLSHFKCILFQIIYALHVAQTEFEFVHNDLHLRNILLKSLPHDKKYMGITDKDGTWILEGYVAKLTDFGLSRITTKAGSVLYNLKEPTAHVFTSNTDIEKLADSLGMIKFSAEDPADRTLLAQLKRLMRKGVAPKTLLHHEFFRSLKERPSDCTNSNTIFVNSSGVDVPLRDLTNTYITPGAPKHINKTSLLVDDVKQKLVFHTPSHPPHASSLPSPSFVSSFPSAPSFPPASPSLPSSSTPPTTLFSASSPPASSSLSSSPPASSSLSSSPPASSSLSSSPPSTPVFSDEEPLTRWRQHRKEEDTDEDTEDSEEDEEEEEEEEESEKEEEREEEEQRRDSSSEEELTIARTSEMGITPKKKPSLPLPSLPPSSSQAPAQLRTSKTHEKEEKQEKEEKEDEEMEEKELVRNNLKTSAERRKPKVTRGDSALNDLVGDFSKISVSANPAKSKISNSNENLPVPGELRRSARLRTITKPLYF